jgi:hypothetical protein
MIQKKINVTSASKMGYGAWREGNEVVVMG